MKLTLASNAALVLASSFFPTVHVHGHAFMAEPETRNSFAKKSGTWSQQAGVPPVETTPQGLNSNTGVCGKQGGAKDYDIWLDSQGNPMPWQSHSIYNKGDEIRVDVTVTAHHFGHFEVKACAMGSSSTQDCFDANPLMYVSEIVDGRQGMPKDENNPHRAMLWGDGLELSYMMKLPDNVAGEEVLLQFVYWTANNCNYDGYDEYFSITADIPPSSNDSWNAGLSGCGDQSQIPMIRVGTVIAEIFVNCAEVTVLGEQSPTPPIPAPTMPRPTPALPAPTAPVPSPTWRPAPSPVASPVPAPVANPVASPVSEPTSSGGNGTGNECCSMNFKTCAGWGNASKENCEAQGSMIWLENGNLGTECEAKDTACTASPESCCPGLTCDGSKWYKQCKYIPNQSRRGLENETNNHKNSIRAF